MLEEKKVRMARFDLMDFQKILKGTPLEEDMGAMGAGQVLATKIWIQMRRPQVVTTWLMEAHAC